MTQVAGNEAVVLDPLLEDPRGTGDDEETSQDTNRRATRASKTPPQARSCHPTLLEQHAEKSSPS